MTTARRSRRAATVASAVAGAVLASTLTGAPTATAAPRPVPTPPRPAVLVTTDNPWTFQLTNPGVDGLVVRGVANGTGQLVQVFDHAGNPIFSVPPFGGPAVFGDDLRLFPTGSVFGQSLTLRFDGSITLGQQVGSDASPVQQGGPSVYGGNADPNLKPPAHWRVDATGAVVARPFVVGDWYLRSGAGYGLYAWTGSAWLRKL